MSYAGASQSATRDAGKREGEALKNCRSLPGVVVVIVVVVEKNIHPLPAVPVQHPVRLEARGAVDRGHVLCPQALDALEEGRAAAGPAATGGATRGAARARPRHHHCSCPTLFHALALSLSLPSESDSTSATVQRELSNTCSRRFETRRATSARRFSFQAFAFLLLQAAVFCSFLTSPSSSLLFSQTPFFSSSLAPNPRFPFLSRKPSSSFRKDV